MEIVRQNLFDKYSPAITDPKIFFDIGKQPKELYLRHYEKIIRRITNKDHIPINCLYLEYSDSRYRFSSQDREIFTMIGINNPLFENYLSSVINKMFRVSSGFHIDLSSTKTLYGYINIMEKVYEDWSKAMLENTIPLAISFNNPPNRSRVSITEHNIDTLFQNFITNSTMSDHNKLALGKTLSKFNTVESRGFMLSTGTKSFVRRSSSEIEKFLSTTLYILLTAAIKRTHLELFLQKDLTKITKEQFIDAIVLLMDSKTYDIISKKNSFVAQIINTMFNLFYENDFEIIVADDLLAYLIKSPSNEDLIRKGQVAMQQFINQLAFTDTRANNFAKELTI
jgi:hypothetical protein